MISRIAALIVMLIGCVAIVQAQQPNKVPRIGFLAAGFASDLSVRAEAFRQGLRELGYVEGKDIVLEYRWAEGKTDRLSEFARELARLKVDAIVTAGPAATRRAKEATSTIPIVMAFDTDPVGSGFVASLARPGGNVTGLSSVAPEIAGKQLELLKEIVPRLSRVAIVGDPTVPGNAQTLREAERAARTLGLQLLQLDARDPKEIENAFQAASERRADAVLVLVGTIALSQRVLIAKLALRSRLPVMYPYPEFVEVGGLMTYSVRITDLYRRAAIYVDKILKGAKPADLPVEQPTNFEWVINLKAAKQIGVTIPPSLLVRADRVIE